jgi:CRP/FNR family transcriptional regulator, cyclic AMP receptor protein
MVDTIEPLIQSHPVFRDLNQNYIKLIVGCASNAVFNKEQFVFKEGDRANQFYLIRHGHIIIETYSEKGEAIGIQSVSDGDVLGWSWMVPPYKWHFNAKVIEQSRLIVIDGQCLRDKFERDHDLGYAMMKIFMDIITNRLEATRLQLLDIYK